MPNINVNSPVSSAPTNRLVLDAGWVRPGAAGIGGSLNPSPGVLVGCGALTVGGLSGNISLGSCFEGNEE